MGDRKDERAHCYWERRNRWWLRDSQTGLGRHGEGLATQDSRLRTQDPGPRTQDSSESVRTMKWENGICRESQRKQTKQSFAKSSSLTCAAVAGKAEKPWEKWWVVGGGAAGHGAGGGGVANQATQLNVHPHTHTIMFPYTYDCVCGYMCIHIYRLCELLKTSTERKEGKPHGKWWISKGAGGNGRRGNNCRTHTGLTGCLKIIKNKTNSSISPDDGAVCFGFALKLAPRYRS